MNILFKTFKDAGDLFIIEDYMAENVVTDNDDLFLAGAVIFDKDVHLGTPTVVATRGHVFLNEILEQLGFAPCAAGQICCYIR